MRLLGLISLTVIPFAALGSAPERSLAPKPRPAQVVQFSPTSPFPKHRPIVQKVAANAAPKAGSVCGRSSIRGQSIPRIKGRISGCGIKSPVKINEVAGIRLKPAATVDCTTAKALEKWIASGVKPAFKRHGGVTQLRVAASYSCRTRNNKVGAKLSEHSYGNAIDISAFTLKSGQSVTVLKGWDSRKYSKALRNVHKAACGPFGTVLGPNSDRYHKDHFHFDTARYRSGSYCR